MATCLDYAKMAIATYNATPSQYSASPPGYMVDDWTVQKFVQGGLLGSGFQGAIYNRDRDWVVSFCGTNPGQKGKFFQDLLADMKIAARLIPSQATCAINLTTVAQAFARRGGGRVSLTGHSLGGGLAQVCGVALDLPFCTFNAPAMRGAIEASRLPQVPGFVPGSSLINMAARYLFVKPQALPPGTTSGLNFRLDSDRVSSHLGGNDHIGTHVMLPNVLREAGLMGAHGIAGCWQAVLESDWAFIDPFEALAA
ncbi:MAG: hypothetical protein R3F55_04285 [Alphaproteobacteria bacterium]